jgi:glucose/arabinose dehydrogenase
MMAIARLLMVVLFLLAVHPPGYAEEPDSYTLQPAFPHLSFQRPLALVDPNDGTDRLFVVEQAGRILVFQNHASTRKAKLFLDIRDRVNSHGNEEGLLGLAFHPKYGRNGFIFVNYTASRPRRTVIARFRVDKRNPNKADPGSEVKLLEFAQPYENHNGGEIQFGPDGYLYIGTGDGGSGGDPHNNGQSLETLLGKILRIDVDRPDSGLAYGIPKDNPFVGTAHRKEIWAYGLRNPWRFSFDAATGQLWAGDVGQDAIEEVDIIEKGKNYGWRIMEGNACFNPSTGCDTTGRVRPVWDYSHDTAGVCITGGYVYRGTKLRDLIGAYIYADYGSGRVWALRYDGIHSPNNRELLHSGFPIASFGTDHENELFLCVFDGKIYRLATTN